MVFISSIPIIGLSPFLVYNQAYSISDKNPNDLYILSITTKYNEDLGAFHIYGEVLNNSTSNFQNITLTITFYDAYGNELGVVQGETFFDSLGLREKSGFDIAVFGALAEKIQDFSYYKVAKSWQAAKNSKPGLLRLNVSDILVDNCGNFRITGLVGNLGPESTGKIKISAAFYNERDQIIVSAFTMARESRLKPAGFAPYELVMDRQILPHFARYSLRAQTADYATGNFLEPSLVPSLGASEKNSLTVSTDSSLYPRDPEQAIQVYGNMDNYDPLKLKNPLVTVSILTASGSQVFVGTAILTPGGYFSKTFRLGDFDSPANEQVYRVRATYNGTIAENTFALKENSGGANSSESNRCDSDFAGISLHLLGVLSNSSFQENGTGFDQIDANLLQSVNEIQANSTAVLAATIENELSQQQPVTIVTQVLDRKGIVVFLDLHVVSMLPNSIYHFAVPWAPNGVGRYQIMSFSISGLEQPRILSGTTQASINVS